MSKYKTLNFHPLVAQTSKNIDKSNLDKGCIRCRHYGLDIRVGPNSLDRALNIMNNLIKTLEEKGAKVSLMKKEYKQITCVDISGATLEIDLYEKINIIKKGKGRFGYDEYDYIPNGKLVLRIKNAPYKVRQEWIDGENKKIDDHLDSFIEGLYKAVAREKELEKEREEREKERAKEQAKKDELQRLKNLEQERINNLEKEALSWQKSQIIRTYIEAATKAYIEKNSKIESGSEFDKWKTWAIQQADYMDPLV